MFKALQHHLCSTVFGTAQQKLTKKIKAVFNQTAYPEGRILAPLPAPGLTGRGRQSAGAALWGPAAHVAGTLQSAASSSASLSDEQPPQLLLHP